MSAFMEIQRVLMPRNIVEFIYNHVRQSGEKGMEAVALLFGKQEGSTFQITNGLIPQHNSYSTQNGLLYVVEGEELHRINVWSYRNKLAMIAQVHSHPGEAFHSGTDDDYAIMTTLGGFSIVIPNFGFGPMEINQWEIYRLIAKGNWEHLSRDNVTKLIEIY